MAEAYSILDIKLRPDTGTFPEIDEDEIKSGIDEKINSVPIRNINGNDIQVTKEYIRLSLTASDPNDDVYDEQYGLMGKIIRIIQEETASTSVEAEILKTGAS